MILATVALLTAVASATPNFVVIFVDDWGWGDMGANWNASQTPNLDSIAAQGIRFTDWHSGASVCTPARGAILTGRLGLRTGVVTNFNPHSLYGIPETEHTFAEHLQGAGYATMMFGKWHLGWRPGFHPSYKGFDRALTVPYSLDMGCTNSRAFDLPQIPPCGYDPETGEENAEWQPPVPGEEEGDPFAALYREERLASFHAALESGVELPEILGIPLSNATTNCSGTGLCDSTIVQQPANLSTLAATYAGDAVNFISENARAGKNFLLYAPFSHIHVPLAHDRAFDNKSVANTFFADTLLEVDAVIGRIHQAILEAGVAKNTLLLITGDNGPWNVKCDLAGSQGPFLGSWQVNEGGGGATGKFTLWEGGHREVGVACWPGMIQPRVSNALVSSLDVFPTLLSLAGVPLPTDRDFDGIDLTDVLLHGSEQGHETLFHPDGAGQLHAYRYGELKFHNVTYSAETCGKKSGKTITHDPPLVFNLTADPAESTPITPPDDVMQNAIAASIAKMASINNGFRSHVNYSSSNFVGPCCNSAHDNCRCTQ